METPKRHPHADLINAWADGAAIQVKVYRKQEAPTWVDVENPPWSEGDEYRIKPEDVGSNVGSELDGKPLTDGEKALIKAIRKKKINKVFNESSSILAAIIDDGHGGVVGTVRKYVAIVPSDDLQPISIISALEQIKAEQEVQNEAE